MWLFIRKIYIWRWKINYFEYISSLKNEDCNNALKRIVPLVELENINSIVDNMLVITDIRKEFYKKMINIRYKKILKFSLDKLNIEEELED